MTSTVPIHRADNPLSEICACGRPKPRDTRKCRLCSERDDAFRVLDNLITWGFGDTPQEDLPISVMRLAQTTYDLPRPTPEQHHGIGGPKPIRPPKPRCPKCGTDKNVKHQGKSKTGKYYACRGCWHTWKVRASEEEMGK